MNNKTDTNYALGFATPEMLMKNIKTFEKNAAKETSPDKDIPTPIVGVDGVELGTSKRAGRYHDDYFRHYDRVNNIIMTVFMGANAVAMIAFAVTLLIDILK